MLWLALYFPDLPLEVFSPAKGSSRDTTPAFAVLQGNRIHQHNASAQDQGIVAGSTLATAHSIYPELHHKQRDEVAEQKRLHELADTLYRFSSYVSKQPPDCILLEIGASLKLFHTHSQLATQAIELCNNLGHRALARVAQTPWAAIALARAQQRNLADVPLSDAGLELAGIHANVTERFANMGVYTLGPLLKLPDKALGKRFGKPLLHYLQQLTGLIPDPRSSQTPEPVFSRAVHLLQPITGKGDLYEHSASPLQKLAQELEHWLIAHQLGCEQLLWGLCSHNQNIARILINFAQGKQSAREFIHLSQLKLEQAQLPEEVLSITLQARRLQQWRGNSHGLFDAIAPLSAELGDSQPNTQSKQLMSELIDELNARLGTDVCLGIRSRAQHAPEQAWHTIEAEQLLKPTPRPGTETEPFCPHHAKRPLWLFDPPKPVRRDELDLLHGPERIQSQWWQTQTISRDYYIAQHRLGAQCWTFVDPQDQWYLHGYFG